MFNIPYDTTPCRDYNLQEIYRTIQLNMTDGNLIFSDTLKDSKIKEILLITPEAKDVPPFAHPVEVSLSGRNTVVIDARGWLKAQRDGSLKINSQLDAQFSLVRAKLNHHWLYESKRDLLSVGTLPMTAFCRWIASTISQRLNLQPEQQMIANIIAGFYYISLFDEEAGTPDEDELLKRSQMVSRGTGISTQKILEIVDLVMEGSKEPFVFNNIGSYIAEVKIATQSIRLDNLNTALLYTMLGGSWFGANAREIVAVALEHPPTFLTIVHQALENRSYKKTQLGEFSLRSDRNGEGKTFTYNVVNLIKG